MNWSRSVQMKSFLRFNAHTLIFSSVFFWAGTVFASSEGAIVDPTKPLVELVQGVATTEQTEKEAPLKLESLWWNQRDARAVINNTVLRKGEKIQGYQVTGIENNRVTLKKGEESLELSLIYELVVPKKDQTEQPNRP